ncbi:MAG: A24 family peptidase [Acetobacteraceae bacterium]
MLALWLPLLSCILLLAGAAILLAAAVHDVIARTVPNWMAATLAVIGLASQILHGRPLVSVACALVVFLAAALCWRAGWLGGGDVKLLGAATLLVPPGDVVGFIAAVALIGAGLALIYLAGSRIVTAPGPHRPERLLARAARIERWRMRRGCPLPYACAIAAGFMFVTL